MERSTNPEEVAPLIPPTDAKAIAAKEAENGLVQYDAALDVITASTKAGAFRLRPSLILTMNRLAVINVDPMPGQFRNGPVGIKNSMHRPPPHEAVPGLVEEMCDYVNEHWVHLSPIHLAAYLLWRINWIHPFGNGNGRTARIVSYIVLNLKFGFLLPGKDTIPDQIASDMSDYYSCLDDADAAWKEGRIDVLAMEEMLTTLLERQLQSVPAIAMAPPEHE